MRQKELNDSSMIEMITDDNSFTWYIENNSKDSSPKEAPEATFDMDQIPTMNEWAESMDNGGTDD